MGSGVHVRLFPEATTTGGMEHDMQSDFVHAEHFEYIFAYDVPIKRSLAGPSKITVVRKGKNKNRFRASIPFEIRPKKPVSSYCNIGLNH